MQEVLSHLLVYFLGIVTMITRDILWTGRFKWKEKRQLAKDILAFIDEAQSAGFEKPVTAKHITEGNRLVSLTYPIDPITSTNIQTFFGAWQFFVLLNPDTFKVAEHQYLDHLKFCNERKEALNGIAKDIRDEVSLWLK